MNLALPLPPRFAQQISSIRLDRFLSSKDFKVDASVLGYGKSDAAGTVLGILHEGELVSTMRLERITTGADLRSKLDHDHPKIPLPCALLGKAATRHAFEGRGLNTYLRWIALKQVRDWKVSHLVGTVIEGAPRLKLMEQMGYEFRPHPNGWYRFGYVSRKPALLAVLDLNQHYERALEVLELKIGNLPNLYPWTPPAG